MCSTLCIGSSEQCRIVVLWNEQGAEDALCLECDELLFARHKEQKVYLQYCYKNVYFSATHSDLPDLYSIFKSCWRYLLYSRIKGDFVIHSFIDSSGSKKWNTQPTNFEKTPKPWDPKCTYSVNRFSSSDSSLSNQQTLLSGQKSITKQQEESQKLGAELLQKVSTAQSEFESFFVCRPSFLSITQRPTCSNPSLACATTRSPRLGPSTVSSNFCKSSFRD